MDIRLVERWHAAQSPRGSWSRDESRYELFEIEKKVSLTNKPNFSDENSHREIFFVVAFFIVAARRNDSGKHSDC